MTRTAAPPSAGHQFPLLLCGKAEAGASGILTALRGKLRRFFCLDHGSIVFAASNLVEEQFLDYLVRTGALTPESGAGIAAESARVHQKPAAYLRALNRLSLEEMRRAMIGLIRELSDSTIEWPSGSFQFEEGLPRLDDEITVRLTARSLVLEHAKRYPATIDALRVRVGPPDLRPVVTAVTAHAGLEFDALGAFLVSRCDGSSLLAEILNMSPAGEEDTLRRIYGFMMAGILKVEPAESPHARDMKGVDEALSREECLGRIAIVAGRDHYGVLGVDRKAKPAAIREAYYALARRYHPDRFRSGPLSDLLAQFEDFFRLVTDAHNTLADDERRAAYDEELLAAKAPAESKNSDTGYLARQNFLRGRALAAQRKYTEAVTFLENAVSLDPAHADFRLELGLVLSRNPRHREAAERHLLRAIELAPTATRAYVALGQMYVKAGKMGRAGRMAREALRWEPGHLEASEIQAAAGNAADDEDTIQRGVFQSS